MKYRGMWLLFIPVIILVFNLSKFPYPIAPNSFSDFAISHYPNTVYLQNNLREGIIPLWSSSIMSGYPFYANPLSGIWYPPGWVALLFSQPTGLNLSIILHLLLGGVGMCLFLRKLQFNNFSAIVGALSFQMMPKLLAHLGAGHVTLIYAVAWTPWLLFFSVKDKNKLSLAAGLTFAMIILADVRWAFYAGVLWVAWEAMLLTRNDHHFRDIKNWSAHLLRNGLVSIGISAPYLFSLLQFTRLTTRAEMSSESVLAFSLPVERLLGFFIPGLHGTYEWVVYPGVFCGLATLSGIFISAVRNQYKFWYGVLLVSLIVSLGEALPFANHIASIPPFSFVRVPPRVLFLAGIAGSVLLAAFLDQNMKGQGATKTANKALFGCAFGIFLLTLLTGMVVGNLHPGLYVSGVGVMVIAGMIMLLSRSGTGRFIPGGIIIAVMFLDGLINGFYPSIRYISPEQPPSAIMDIFTKERDFFRIFSPSYSLPQEVAIDLGVELASGVDPLQIVRYVQFMDDASGVPRTGYGVAVPPLEGMPDVANINFIPDPVLLGLLNVRYVIAAFPIMSEGLDLLMKMDNEPGKLFVYWNTQARQRAWIQSEEGFVLSSQPVEINYYSPNTIEIKATGPGQLILSEITYPGWKVAVNGNETELGVYKGVLRSVPIPPGDHVVLFSFRPQEVYIGLVVFLIAVIFIIVWWKHKSEIHQAMIAH